MPARVKPVGFPGALAADVDPAPAVEPVLAVAVAVGVAEEVAEGGALVGAALGGVDCAPVAAGLLTSVMPAL